MYDVDVCDVRLFVIRWMFRWNWDVVCVCDVVWVLCGCLDDVWIFVILVVCVGWCGIGVCGMWVVEDYVWVMVKI